MGVLKQGGNEMGSYLHKAQNGFTVLDNTCLRDKKLTLKAKGLLAIMFSLPDGWEYSIAGLTAICKEGASAVTTALDELKQQGYLHIEKLYPGQSKNGRIEYIYHVFDKPFSSEKQIPEIQNVKIQGMENQGVENRGQLNKDKLNKDKSNKDRLIKDNNIYIGKSDKNITIDDVLQTADSVLKDILIEFVKMRKTTKKPLTPYALSLIIKRLGMLSADPNEQVKIVQQSIMKGWLDVYPLKDAQPQETGSFNPFINMLEAKK